MSRDGGTGSSAMIDLALFNRVCRRLDYLADDMVSLELKLTSIPAIAPENGGDGEWEKAAFLQGVLSSLGLGDIQEVHAPDPRVSSGLRPNLVVTTPGPEDRGTKWVVTHMDVVPPGSRAFWKGDPFTGWVENGRVYGRGTEDNQQDLVASIFALKACVEEGFRLPHRAGLVFVSDEETSSKYGLAHLLHTAQNPFQRHDIIVVPDSGDPFGTLIEIAEKSILWLKFKTIGKQCHASIPDFGINAFLAASHLVVNLHQELHCHFDRRDALFYPSFSTFQPTKKEANVENVNTIPGEDVFYMDARILPPYDLDDVSRFIMSLATDVEEKFGVTIEITEAQRVQAPPPTSENAPVVNILKEAISKVYNVEAKPQGIGAGTVAAYLRRDGYPVAVWCKTEVTAHQPNEYALIDNIVGDAKVFSYLFLKDLQRQDT